MDESKKSEPGTCDDCGKAPASVHIRKVTADDDEEMDLHLCASCAEEAGVAHDTDDTPVDAVTLMFRNMSEDGDVATRCGDCGMTYERFRETGRLGCARCYTTFGEELDQILRRVHGSVQHVGRGPSRDGEDNQVAARLRRLNEDLDRAIGGEDYERAAELRDLIQQLETSGSEPETRS